MDIETYIREHIDRLMLDYDLEFLGVRVEDLSKESLVRLLKYEVADARCMLKNTGKRMNHGAEWRCPNGKPW